MKPGVDYIGIGAGATIFNKEGKVFLAKRGKMARNEVGKWEFPGGKVEFNERREDAVKREIKEEFGFNVEPFEVLSVSDHIIPEEKQHWVTTGFLCLVVSGEPQILEPEKIEQIGWFPLEELDNMVLSLVTQERVQSLKKKFPNGIPNFYDKN